MKRVLKITGVFLPGIIVLAIIVSTISYNNYWAKDPNGKVIPENLSYYHETYEECRADFLKNTQILSKKFDNVQIDKFNVNSEVDNDLSIDYCYIPAQKQTEKLLIVNSGTHGIEGYTGSAIQQMFMQEILLKEDLDKMGILLIHGINPYGFKYHRKVTENNVDMNRNWVINAKEFDSPNDGYAQLSDMLMPEGEVKTGNLRNKFFHLVAIAKILKESMPVLRQAALQGQYDFDKGIYYGGKAPEPQGEFMKTLLKNTMEEYDIVMNLDLHTAFGERGKLHIFLDPIEDPVVKNGIETIFDDVEIDWGSGEDFYTIHGEYIGWAGSLCDSALYLPMLFEFGTLDSQKTFGSLKSIQIMINENQGAHYGYKNEKQEKKVKHLFDEMYYPSSPVWRSKVITDSREMMEMMLTNFRNLN